MGGFLQAFDHNSTSRISSDIGIVVEAHDSDSIGVCYQGEVDYLEKCVAKRSPVGQAEYRHPVVKPGMTCKEQGFTVTTVVSNPDPYYGKHNVSIWFVESSDIGKFFGRMLKSPKAIISMLGGWGYVWRLIPPICK